MMYGFGYFSYPDCFPGDELQIRCVTSVNSQEAWQALDCQARVGFDTLICHPQHLLCTHCRQVSDAVRWLTPVF